jgi:exosome complex component RRP41
VLACVINALTLALIDAGIPMTDQLVAMTVACLPDAPTEATHHASRFLIDVSGSEEQSPHRLPTMTIVASARNKQIVATRLEPTSRWPLDSLSDTFQAILPAIDNLHAQFIKFIKNK